MDDENSDDDTPVTPPIEEQLQRIARAHTNPKQHGARRIEFKRHLRGDHSSDEMADALDTLVSEGTLQTVKVDETVYYQLSDDRHADDLEE